jgi:hypothetical protein
MLNIEDIIKSVHDRKLRITDHADEEANNDGISIIEVLDTISAGEIIEQYPDDKPYPSCLILGTLKDGRPIHTVWAFNDNTQSSVLITIYRPDPKQWVDGKFRRQL